MNAPFRLIPATVDRESAIAVFLDLATAIQCRNDVDMVTALQMACDECPAAYDAYFKAMQR